MSAIFGILDLEGRPIDPAWIKSMQTDLAHRGPDGEGLYQDDSIVLGHKLLQVTPESIYDKSPYEEDGLVITANARLDEREAIMDRLDIPQTERETITDPLLLLRSYKKYGKDFVIDIYGDFAFAIWDKGKKELFCARDQMGVKPFLYYFQDGRFVFSTELKAIVKLQIVRTELDHEKMRNFLIGIEEDNQKTNWKNIKRINPATNLILFDNRISVYKYWSLSYRRNLRYKTEQDAATVLLELLKKVIADHIRVKGNVGVPLSGGLDSSTITCIASRILNDEGKRLRTVSSILNVEEADPLMQDEQEYIQSLLVNETNIDSEFVYHSNFAFLENIDVLFNRHYAPINSTYYIDEEICQKFQFSGVRRLLSGYLGDLTVTNSTINPLPILLKSGQIKTFIKLLAKIKKNNSDENLFSVLRSYVLGPIAPLYIHDLKDKIKGKSKFEDFENLPLFLSKKNKKEIKLRVSQDIRKEFQDRCNIAEHICPSNWDPFLEDWDCGSSYYEIEISYPLFDRRIVELLAQLPVEHFYADGLKRGLIRKTMNGILPDLIKDRNNKGGYSPGYNQILSKGFEKFKNQFKNDNLRNISKNIYDFERIQFQAQRFIEQARIQKIYSKDFAILDFLITIAFYKWSINNLK